ncbi:hypothetical protein BDV95DRAFT_546987 [Massariosphaeria phaeospora]|uniref:Allergen n=1 Tax=Massariosphaeria phaeospora TaxID=100035 RepID=A0A7C8I6Y9_9PLEO|nr:hypothetical protein BDV95DRAFT_546987 [Massariosphaeria phaeospora]
MDKAKNAVRDFIKHSGHSDTTVHETVAPAVKHEVIKPTQHEEVVTAVDKEVHQDHYHRTIQPVKDKEILPEKHTHNLAAVQHREVDHRDHDRVQRELQAEETQFKNTRVVTDATVTQSAAPVVAGEHVHHHIHETIQPVIHKEVIQPTVVHTTVPIHEVHHESAKHHQTSELPPVSLDEFKQRGGVLGGREERYDEFEGAPKHIGGTLSNLEGREGHHGSSHLPNTTSRTAGTSAGSGLTGSGTGLTGSHSHNTPGTGLTGSHNNTTGTGLTGSHNNTTGTGLPGSHNTTGTGVTGSNTHTKPSLLQKLNPMKDTDGDGKKGIME